MAWCWKSLWMIPLEAAPTTTTWSPVPLMWASCNNKSRSHHFQHLLLLGRAERRSAFTEIDIHRSCSFERTCNFWASSQDTPSRRWDCGPALIPPWRRFSLICFCFSLNSFEVVPIGTNWWAISNLTGVLLCVGEQSGTHWNKQIPMSSNSFHQFLLDTSAARAHFSPSPPPPPPALPPDESIHHKRWDSKSIPDEHSI